MKKHNVVLIGSCLILLTIAVAYGAGTVSKSLIGLEDFYRGNESTFSRTTSSGYSLTMHRVEIPPSPDTLYLEWYGAIGDGSTDDTAAVEAAITACPATGCRLRLTQTYRIVGDVSIPAKARVDFASTGVLDIDSTYTVTFVAPEYLTASCNQQIFDGDGSVVFTNPGTVHAEWWGLDNTGATDSQAVLASVVTAVAAGSVIEIGRGTFQLDDNWNITKGVGLSCAPGDVTTLKAGANMAGKSLITYLPAQPYIDMRNIENCILDGDFIAETGFEIKQGSYTTFRNVTAKQFLGAGFLVNGDRDAIPGGNGGYLFDLNFYNCNSKDNYIGYHVWSNGSWAAMAAFNFYSCGAYANRDAGLFLQGGNETTTEELPAGYWDYRPVDATWIGGQIEITSYYGSSVKMTNGSWLYMTGCYFEPDYRSFSCSGSPCSLAQCVRDGVACTTTDHGDYGPSSGFGLSSGSFAELVNSKGAYWWSTFEGNSTLCSTASLLGTEYEASGHHLPIDRQCTGTKTYDRSAFGPQSGWSEDSSSTSGYKWRKGYTMTDRNYNKWVSLGTRTLAGAAGKERWQAPVTGRIVREITAADLNDNFGSISKPFYFNGGDFVVTDMDLIVTEAFTVGSYESLDTCADYAEQEGLKFGDLTNRGKFISKAQASIDKLVANATIRASENRDSTNVLGVSLTGDAVAAEKTATITHAASPGGNQVYVKYDDSGFPYLCSNLASATADKIVTFGSAYTLLIKHDDNASAGGYAIYFDEDATQPNRLLAALPGGKSDHIRTSDPAHFLRITYNASPGTPGVAVNYDDGADNHLEYTSPSPIHGTLDLCKVASYASKLYYMPGKVYSDAIEEAGDWRTIADYMRSYVYLEACPRGSIAYPGANAIGTWATGKAYLVITGYPLEY